MIIGDRNLIGQIWKEDVIRRKRCKFGTEFNNDKSVDKNLTGQAELEDLGAQI